LGGGKKEWGGSIEPLSGDKKMTAHKKKLRGSWGPSTSREGGRTRKRKRRKPNRRRIEPRKIKKGLKKLRVTTEWATSVSVGARNLTKKLKKENQEGEGKKK